MKVVNVHQLHLLIPTLPTFTNLTYYHAPKALRMNSIEGIVFGHGIVFVGRWCWRPPSGRGTWTTPRRPQWRQPIGGGGRARVLESQASRPAAGNTKAEEKW